MSHFRFLVIAFVVSFVLTPSVTGRRAAEGLHPCRAATRISSDLSLPPFQKFLEENYNVRCTMLDKKAVDDLPGLEKLDDCDVAFVFIKRMKLKDDQLAKFKAYATSGKPIVAVRTASHAVQTWLEFDHEVLGGNYKSHHPRRTGDDDRRRSRRGVASDSQRRFADVVDRLALQERGSRRRHSDCCFAARFPMQPTEAARLDPRLSREGAIFYTSLGSQAMFENADFRRMLANALFWTPRREVESK